MADMAPALTGAAQEAPHRLKLSARGGLLLLNGGEKGRPIREGGCPENAPGPKAGGQVLRPGTPGKVHGVKPMERTGPKELLLNAPGPGQRTGASPGPKERKGSSPGPKERKGSSPGLKERKASAPGRKGSLPGSKERKGSSPGPKEHIGSSLGPKGQIGSSPGPKEQIRSSLGPRESTGSVRGPGERSGATPGPKQRIGSALRPRDSTGSALGPGERSGASPGPKQQLGSALVPEDSTGSTLGPVERSGATPGPKQQLGSALVPGDSTGSTLGPVERSGATTGPKQQLRSVLVPGDSTGSTLGSVERSGATPGPKQQLGSALGPGERTGATSGLKERQGSLVGPREQSGERLVPKERLGSLLVLGERTGAVVSPGQAKGATLGSKERLASLPGLDIRTAPGPGTRITAVAGLKRKSEGAVPSESPVNASGTPVHSGPRLSFLQDPSASSHSSPGPVTSRGRISDITERLKGKKNIQDDAPGPTMHSSAGHLAPQDGMSGLSSPLESALETPLDCIPVSPPDSAPAFRGSAPRPSSSQDAEPGPKVLCALRAAQMSSRQQELGARARRLCRRLQVIQAKQVERHVRQQLSGLVELLSERGPDGLPGSPHVELDRLACSSTARLRAAQGGFDSDATDSSSGGESDAEEEPTTLAVTRPEEEKPEKELSQAQGCDRRRAEWRWAVERAAIICRWTWLQAQVSDLEFRIRQQTEFYKQIRCTKGNVVLGDNAHREDSTTRQTTGSPLVLNSRGNRVPSSSQNNTKPPSGADPCDGLPSAPTPSSQGSKCSRLPPSADNVANPASLVCESSGSQKSSRQVNGLLNCVRSSASCNGSAEVPAPEALLGKKRRLDALSASPALSDSTCVAARTRPLRGHKKRPLVRCSDVSSLSRKPQKPLSARCGCEPPTTCILCECKTPGKSAAPGTATLSERIALMDPSYHPILSFPHDTPLHLHFESLLKDDRQFRLSHKLKILKLSHLSKKPQERQRRDSFGQSLEITGRSVFRDDRQHRAISSPNIQVSSPFTPRPNPVTHQPPTLPETPPSSIGQQNSASAALKRKRFEDSYDIDNIVIPMSLVAASRVEKLQYKEILTPSWCLLDSSERGILTEDPQLEDLSDDAYLERHSKNEELERSRWDSWTSALPQRRGSRSSNKSEGRWTPQPPSNSQGSQQNSSPDIRFHSLNDGPLSLSSAAADNLEPYSTVQCLAIQSRTRVLSWSEDTRSSTPEIPDDEEQTIQPWEHRFFPLSDRDFLSLQDVPVTPVKGKSKPPSESVWPMSAHPSVQTESIDSGMSTEHLTPASKESPLPNSISVVRVRAHSGDRIASLEYLPARPVNKR